MRLVIDIDLDKLPENTADEVGRILRYWAGAAGQIPLDQVAAHDLMDSAYRAVGVFRIE